MHSAKQIFSRAEVPTNHLEVPGNCPKVSGNHFEVVGKCLHVSGNCFEVKGN